MKPLLCLVALFIANCGQNPTPENIAQKVSERLQTDNYSFELRYFRLVEPSEEFTEYHRTKVSMQGDKIHFQVYKKLQLPWNFTYTANGKQVTEKTDKLTVQYKQPPLTESYSISDKMKASEDFSGCSIGHILKSWLNKGKMSGWFSEKIREGKYVNNPEVEGRKCDHVVNGIHEFVISPEGDILKWVTKMEDPHEVKVRLYFSHSTEPIDSELFLEETK